MVLHLLLGESVPVGTVVGRVILPSLALNLILAVPVYALCRVIFPPPERREREVALV